jgi:LPXTG-motif cell wall-anchored protein
VSEPSTVQVAVAGTPPPPPPPTTPPPTAPADPGELPATGGGNLARTIGLGAALLLAGSAIVQIARRRRRPA